MCERYSNCRAIRKSPTTPAARTLICAVLRQAWLSAQARLWERAA